MKKKKIVITGGHLTPALATIDELEKQADWLILFIGRKRAMEGDKTPPIEAEIIPQKGIRFVAINAGRIQRRFTRWTLSALIKIPLGFFQALAHLLWFRPKVILSFGGYVSVPVVLAGSLLRIPVVTHEQTTVRGLASKLNAFFARRIAVSWPQTVAKFPSEKVVLTGNPLRKEIFKTDKEFWQSLKIKNKLPLIFITAGNQGSHTINQAVSKVLLRLLKKANVFHQVGYPTQLAKDFQSLKSKQKRLPFRLQGRYQLKKYLPAKEMATLLNKADLVISRAGANTLTELMVLGKPALLIPLPWLYQNEQLKNAEMLARMGMAEILPQEKLSGKTLLLLIEQMLKDLSSYQKNAQEAKKLIKKDAAKRLADLVKSLVD